MAEPLASLDDLKARLEFDLDDAKMEGLANAALVDASVLVREYGVDSWTATTAPPIAVMLTLKAAARFMNNPMSLETARGADETNMWGESNSKGVYLEPSEIELLREHRKTNKGLTSVSTTLWGRLPVPGQGVPYVLNQSPVSGYGSGLGKLFPDYQPGDTYNPIYPSDWVI